MPSIALPELTVGLHASLDQVLWIVNAYTLTYAALLITGGRLGDMFGTKRLFMIGLALFTGASAVCGAAQTPAQLIGARALQGIGGALLTPQTLAIVTVSFPPNRRGAAYGVWGAVAGLATIAGPAFGGWLVTSFTWRCVFYVNLPIGLATLGLAAAFLPDLRFGRRHRLDWRGMSLVSLGLFLISFGLIEGPSHRWSTVWGPVTVPAILGAGLAVLLLFGWWQHANRDREPLVPAGIYANRNFAVMSGVVAAVSFGMLGLFLPLVIFLQSVLSRAVGSGCCWGARTWHVAVERGVRGFARCRCYAFEGGCHGWDRCVGCRVDARADAAWACARCSRCVGVVVAGRGCNAVRMSK